MKSLKPAAVGLAFAGLFVGSASAAPTPLTFIEGSPFCEASLSGFNPTPVECWGSFAGNNNGQGTAQTIAFIEGKGLTNVLDLGSSDQSGSGPFTSNPGGNTGILTFDTAVDGPFVLALKGSDRFSLFYFNGSGPAIGSIQFSMAGVDLNNNGGGNALSHATLYSATAPIPEPETYALMLAGLGAVGFMARRRKAAASGLQAA